MSFHRVSPEACLVIQFVQSLNCVINPVIYAFQVLKHLIKISRKQVSLINLFFKIRYRCRPTATGTGGAASFSKVAAATAALREGGPRFDCWKKLKCPKNEFLKCLAFRGQT